MSYNDATRKRRRNQNILGWALGVSAAGGLIFGITQIDFPEVPPPCQMSVSAEALQAAQSGFEVDVNDQYGNECELTPQGTWVVDD